MTSSTSAASSRTPTALITWAHADPEWNERQVEARHENVVRLAAALRRFGIDTDADFYHDSDPVDWTRWGPARVREVDVVLIVASRAWAQAWEGRGDMSRNVGVAAEASVLRSIETEGRNSLKNRCRVLLLPGSSEDDIPDGLHGVNRYRISAFDFKCLEPLIRDLTGQPRYVKPPLGSVPTLPPKMTDRSTSHARAFDQPAVDTRPGRHAEAAEVGELEVPPNPAERRAQLKAQLDALPTPQPGEGPHLPWYREWERVQRELADLDGHAAIDPSGPTEASERLMKTTTPSGQSETDHRASRMTPLPWQPVEREVSLNWISADHNGPLGNERACVYLHLLAMPVHRISGRIFAAVTDELPKMFRTHVPSVAGLEVEDRPERVSVRVQGSQGRSFNAADPGGLRGVLLEIDGGVTVWAQLPSDGMGAVLDPERLAADLTGCIRVATAALAAAGIAESRQVVVAAEVTPTTLLTNGTMDQLGNRSSVSLPGALRHQPVRMKPEETLALSVLAGPRAGEVATVVSQLLQRAWRQS